MRRQQAWTTYPAQVVLSCRDDDRPANNGVRPDEPHHPVLQVHLAYACIVRVYVPCSKTNRTSTQRSEIGQKLYN